MTCPYCGEPLVTGQLDCPCSEEFEEFDGCGEYFEDSEIFYSSEFIDPPAFPESDIPPEE
jgi:hypothetical protein